MSCGWLATVRQLPSISGLLTAANLPHLLLVPVDPIVIIAMSFSWLQSLSAGSEAMYWESRGFQATHGRVPRVRQIV